MTNYRTFGTWLRAYEGDDSIGDLRDDFVDDCRSRNITASTVRTGAEMESMMYRTSLRYGITPCQEALEALEEACILYGDPWRIERDDEDEDDDDC